MSPSLHRRASLYADTFTHSVSIPTHLLIFSILTCLYTAVVLQNHASLTEGRQGAPFVHVTADDLRIAVGSTTYSLRPRKSAGPNKSRLATTLHNALLANPFSLTVLAFAFALASASLIIPAQQLAPLDKVVALLESIAMFYIAYPAAVATGKVLLQTAPPVADFGAGETNALRRALDEVSQSPRSVQRPEMLIRVACSD